MRLMKMMNYDEEASYVTNTQFIGNYFRNVVLPSISNFEIIVHHLHQTNHSSDN